MESIDPEDALSQRVVKYVPQTILPFIQGNSESWINELRCVSVCLS